MGNPRVLLQRWLSEYKALGDDQISGYASKLSSDTGYFSVLEKVIRETQSVEDLAPVCHQLYSFYRSGQTALCLFVVELLPVLIGAYMRSMADYQGRTGGRAEVLESCLLGLHNFFVTEEAGKPRSDFRIPGIGYSSVFHDGITRPEIKEAMSELIASQPTFAVVDNITEANRGLFLYGLVYRYTRQLTGLSAVSQEAFCAMCHRIVSLDSKPRIQLRSDFLVEVVCGVYQVLFLHKARIAMDVLYEVERRAEFDLLHEPLIIVNGIRNSLDTNPSGRPTDGPIGIHPTSTAVLRHPSVSAITNASFRPEKLPEDIPIQKAATERSPLGAVVEHREGDSLEHDTIDMEFPATKDSAPKLLSKLGTRLKRGSDKEKNIYVPVPTSSTSSAKVMNNNEHTASSNSMLLKKSSLRNSLEDSDCDEAGPNIPPMNRSITSSSKL